MGIAFYREKLLNAVLYFASNTRKTNLTKLLKLLYLLDFQHVKETGYPSINLVYYTWQRGPVPKDFYEEVKDGNVPDDFVGRLAILPSGRWEQEYPDRKEYLFKAMEKPQTAIFTPRELKIMGNLCEIYRDATAAQMSEVTHLCNKPWDTTKKTKGLYERIDYLLAVDNTSPLDRDEAEIRLREHSEMMENFHLKPTKVE